MRLFLDANVLFTAAYSPEGVSRALFGFARAGRCTLLTSRFALDEAGRNLAVKAPRQMPELTGLLDGLEVVEEAPLALVGRARAAPIVEKDAPILAAAWFCSAELLITGDRADFGHLMGRPVGGLSVVTPRAVLELLLGRTDV